ncbi:MAG TPA: VWA domain-containing protein [Thermoanaerobaculia bacterium]|nr:VWA domain-containing protein [Thermoanaerobaculia bacterium]
MSRRTARIARVAAALSAMPLLVASLAAAQGTRINPASNLNVRIISPQADQAVFGQVVFEVNVAGADPVDRVEFMVDGTAVGVARRPPFRVTAQVGEDNVQREFRAVAYAKGGAWASAKLITLPIRIDDKMNVRLQQLYVTVLRGRDRALDLDAPNFHIFDEGQEQKIVTFGRGELPLTAVLLLDSSESMRGELLEAAERGASAFIAAMKPLDEAMVALFSDRLLRITPFVQEPEPLRQALTGIEARGGTAVNDYLYMALDLLESRQGRRVVVLLSDGSDVNSVLSMTEVLRKARHSQALIYWIQLEGGEKHHSYTTSWRGHLANDKEYKLLQEAVEESGGRIQPVNRVAEIEPVFRGVMQELREQYALGYYPSNLKGDGSWHKIKVKADDFAVKVRTTQGYLDF